MAIADADKPSEKIKVWLYARLMQIGIYVSGAKLQICSASLVYHSLFFCCFFARFLLDECLMLFCIRRGSGKVIRVQTNIYNTIVNLLREVYKLPSALRYREVYKGFYDPLLSILLKNLNYECKSNFR